MLSSVHPYCGLYTLPYSAQPETGQNVAMTNLRPLLHCLPLAQLFLFLVAQSSASIFPVFKAPNSQQTKENIQILLSLMNYSKQLVLDTINFFPMYSFSAFQVTLGTASEQTG